MAVESTSETFSTKDREHPASQGTRDFQVLDFKLNTVFNRAEFSPTIQETATVYDGMTRKIRHPRTSVPEEVGENPIRAIDDESGEGWGRTAMFAAGIGLLGCALFLWWRQR